MNSSSERRRHGWTARFQRALTGWLLTQLQLRRDSDARRRRGVISAVNLMMFALFLYRPVVASTGTEGASFLNIPVGARPAALGSGYTALADDAYAPVWNPAGLGFLENTEVAGQHLSYLESIHYEHLGIVHPFQKGRALGFSVQYLGSGDIQGMDLDGNPTGDFSSHYAAYALAYGHALTDRWTLGVTGKWINAKIADVSANAFAFDFGTMFKAHERLRLATVLTNAGTKLKFLRDGDSLPLAIRFGALLQVLPQVGVNAEVAYRKSGLASGHFGVEWRPIEAVALRAGYRTDTLKGLSPLAGLTTGIGVHVWGHEFSYAWLPYGDLGNTQYFSLVMRFGGAADRKRNLIQFQTLKTHQMVQKPDSMPEYKEISHLISETPDLTAMERIEREMLNRVSKGDQKSKAKSRSQVARRTKKATPAERKMLQDLMDQPQPGTVAKK